MTWAITNNKTTITFTPSSGSAIEVPKGKISLEVQGNNLVIRYERNTDSIPEWIVIAYSDVTSPTVASASAFKTIIEEMIAGTTAVVVATPVTTDTVTIDANTSLEVINPAGTIAALTLNFPTGVYDGQPLRLAFTQIVTAITTTGAALQFALTSAAVGDKKHYQWSASLNKWV